MNDDEMRDGAASDGAVGDGEKTPTNAKRRGEDVLKDRKDATPSRTGAHAQPKHRRREEDGGDGVLNMSPTGKFGQRLGETLQPAAPTFAGRPAHTSAPWIRGRMSPPTYSSSSSLLSCTKSAPCAAAVGQPPLRVSKCPGSLAS